MSGDRTWQVHFAPPMVADWWRYNRRRRGHPPGAAGGQLVTAAGRTALQLGGDQVTDGHANDTPDTTIAMANWRTTL